MYRNTIVQVRFAPEDHAAVTAICAELGISRSAAIRAAIYHLLFSLSEDQKDEQSNKSR